MSLPAFLRWVALVCFIAGLPLFIPPSATSHKQRRLRTPHSNDISKARHLGEVSYPEFHLEDLPRRLLPAGTWQTCEEVVAEEEYHTRSTSILWALVRVLVFGDRWGSCDKLCPEICSASACYDYTVVIDSCTCGPFLCHSDATCTDSAECTCNDGFMGDGAICCDGAVDGMTVREGTCAVIDVSDAVFLEGGSRLEQEQMEVDDESTSDVYLVDYTLEAAEAGVVSLNALAPFVLEMQCFTYGYIRVRIDPEAIRITRDISELYPVGAILVVSRELFGLCERPGQNRWSVQEQDGITIEEELEAAAEQRSFELSDYYMKIERVTGTFDDVVIEGSTASFFDMFPEGSIDIRINEARSRSTLLGLEIGPLPDGSTQYSYTTDKISYFLGLIKVQGRATLVERGSYGGFSSTWSRTSDSFGFTIDFVQETELIMDLTTSISDGLDEPAETVFPSIFSFPLLGPPKVDLNKGPFDQDFGFSLSFGAGVYFEIPLILKGNIELEYILEPTPTFEYHSGRIQHSYSLTGPFYALPIGGPATLFLMDFEDNSERVPDPETGVIQDDPFYNFTVKPEDDPNPGIPDEVMSNPLTVNVDVTFGFRPQIAAYIPFLNKPLVRASADIGIGLLIKRALIGSFAPIDQFDTSLVFGRLYGSWNQCHRMQMAFYAIVDSFGIFAFNGYAAKAGLTMVSKFLTLCTEVVPPDETCTEMLELTDNGNGGDIDSDSTVDCLDECLEAKNCRDDCSPNFFLGTICLENCLYEVSLALCVGTASVFEVCAASGVELR